MKIITTKKFNIERQLSAIVVYATSLFVLLGVVLKIMYPIKDDVDTAILCYFFSTVAQSLAAVIGILAAFVLFRIDHYNKELEKVMRSIGELDTEHVLMPPFTDEFPAHVLSPKERLTMCTRLLKYKGNYMVLVRELSKNPDKLARLISAGALAVIALDSLKIGLKRAFNLTAVVVMNSILFIIISDILTQSLLMMYISVTLTCVSVFCVGRSMLFVLEYGLRD